MNALYLIAEIAGRDVAVRTDNVESVVKVNDVISIPAVAPQIVGLFALRSRVLTVVDCRWFIDHLDREIAEDIPAIVVEIDGHGYALVVDKVRDVADIDVEEKAVMTRLGSGWDEIGSAILDLEDQKLLVVDPAKIVHSNKALAA